MARPVVLGVLTPAPLQDAFTDDFDFLIARMQQHWASELQTVLCDKPDLILLPEACDRYCTFTPEQRLQYYEARGDKMLQFFQEVAKKHHCYIVYSAARKMQDGTYRNSSQLIGRSGAVEGIYNKNCLVDCEITQSKMLCGKEAPVFQCDFGTVGCVICFDLNFEEVLAQYQRTRPELLLFSSMYHGGYLQKHWAYMCRSYFVGAPAALPASVINPVGEEIARTTNYCTHKTVKINLDYAVVHLDNNWPKMLAAKQKYGADLELFDPGFLGAVLLTYHGNMCTINDILAEFDIVLLDDYWQKERAYWAQYTEA